MSNAHEQWTDGFTDYLSDEMDGPSREALEAHVAGCGPCRRVLEELRGVVARAQGLEERRPTRDLWPGIAAAIRMPVRPHAEAGSARVIALPTARAERGVLESGRIAFTAPQLAAAAVVLIALSVGTTWWAGPGLGVRVVDAPQEPVAGAVTAASLPAPSDEMSEELTSLQETLEAARSRLDPNTVRVLERNLAVIEQAIADSRMALALDPENEFLTHHLERVRERKVEYLRDAVRIIDWAG